MKVGDYVRTKYGVIGKITEIIDFNQKNEKPYLNHRNMLVLTNNENKCVTGSRGEIIASSPNIIDLIEVGDYVNGHLVFDKAPNCVYIEDNQNKMAHIPYEREHIKSIVTKEMFSNAEYRVEND